MSGKPQNVTDKQMSIYEKISPIKAILREITLDYTIDGDIADLAADINSNHFDITNQEQVNLLAKLNPNTGKIESLGLKAAASMQKADVLDFLQRYYEHIKLATKDNPIYDFQYHAGSPKECVEMYKAKTIQTPVRQFNDSKNPLTPLLEAFEKENQQHIAKIAEDKKDFDDVRMKILNNKSLLETLQEKAQQEEKEKACMNVASGRSKALLGRHENYTKLANNPVDQYDGIPMAGLALLVANSLVLNRNVKDSSTQLAQSFDPIKDLDEDEKKLMQQVVRNQEKINVGAKILDSYFNGNDISRMGNRATSIVNSRKALNDAMKAYMQGNKDPLADLIADSFDTVYDQMLYTSDNLSKVGISAIAEIYDACETMFNNDPELQEMTGISQKRMNILKGASIAYKQLADPKNKLLKSYESDNGPGSPEREEALQELLFTNYLESTIAMDVNRNRAAADKIGYEIADEEYGDLIQKYPEDDQQSVRDAIMGRISRMNLKAPSAFDLLGRQNGTIAKMKKNFVAGLKKNPEYKKYLRMEKDELYKTDFKKFTDKLAEQAFKRFDEKKAAQEKAEFIKTNEPYFEKASWLENTWMELANDYSLPKPIAALAAHFANTKIDITKQDQLDLLAVRDPQTGEYVSAGIQATSDLSKESMLKFINDFYGRIKAADNAIYDFGFLSTKTDSIIELGLGKGDSIAFDTKYMKNTVPDEPFEVDEPNIFKSVTNKLFGWYKTEVNAYREYERKLSNYRKAVTDKPIDEAAKKKFCKNHKEILDRNKQYNKYHKEKKTQLSQQRSIENKLRDKVAEEQKLDRCVEVVAGRSYELLGRHENYETLTKLHLDEVEGMPMGGLALLVANSISVNQNVRDASTQMDQKFHTDQPLDKAEKNFIDEISHGMAVANVGAKIMESLYTGKDTVRMGDRATSVIESRKLLNDAVSKYMSGENEQPLADLINDSIDVLYQTALEMGDKAVTGQGKAVSEMYKALDKVFRQDPEFRKKINITDEQFKYIGAVSKICDLLGHPQKQLLDAYQKDEGPGTRSRERMLDDIMFKRCLYASLKHEVLENRGKSSTKSYELVTSPVMNALFDKFPAKQKHSLMVAAQSTGSAEFLQNARIVKMFEDENMNLEIFKGKVIDQIRTTPEYQKLMGMEKTEFYAQDFDQIAEKLIDDRDKKLTANKEKAKEKPEAKKDGEQIKKNKAQAQMLPS